MTKKGILIIADKNQEWLLPWWWFNYSQLNNLEVSFVNLGMSQKALAWCKSKGNIIFLKKPKITISSKKVETDLHKKWQRSNGKKIWKKRQIWFLKPISFLQTPYDETIYMDLDCEVRTNVNALFSYCQHPSGFSASFEEKSFQEYYQKRKEILPGEKVINSGVIIYKKNCPFLKLFAQQALLRNHEFFGDQNLFQRLIFENQVSFKPLPYEYNFIPHKELDPSKASIIHWAGPSRKSIIKKQIETYSSLSFMKWDTF